MGPPLACGRTAVRHARARVAPLAVFLAPMIPFAKGHGLGNDYLVIEERHLTAPLSADAIVKICDRNWRVGSDGILLLVPSSRADFRLRIFNPDGSEAEKSGNGLRIFAKYLWDHGRAKTPTFTVETKGGLVECQCHVRDGRVNFVTVEMGRATFRAPEIPMNGPDREVVGVPLQLADGTTLRVTAVSVGNPHCVDRKSTRLNSSHSQISYAVFCLKKKKKNNVRVSLTYDEY